MTNLFTNLSKNGSEPVNGSRMDRHYIENGPMKMRKICAVLAMLWVKLVNLVNFVMQIFKLTKLTKLTEQICAESLKSLKCLKSLMQIFATSATSASANFVGKASCESTVRYREWSRIPSYCLRYASDFTSGQSRSDSLSIVSRKSVLATLLLCLTLGVGNAWGAYVAAYTFETSQNSSNTGYGSTYDVTIDSKSWNVPGNQNFSGYVRIGGKELSGVDRVITGKSSLGDAITKITLSHGGVSNANLTVNSITITVSSKSDFSSVIDTKTVSSPSISASKAGTIDFTPTSPLTEWAKDSYYKITINVSNSTKTNCGLDVKSVTFYKSVTSYTVTWKSNGTDFGETSVASGSKPTFPTPNPTSCDLTSTTFVGWTQTPWSGTTDDISGKTTAATKIYTSASQMPAVTGNVTYHAVFAKVEDNSTNVFSDDMNISGTSSVSSRSGWYSFSTAYGGNGSIRLSSSGYCGSMVTNALTSLSGTATITFKAKQWSASEYQVRLQASKGSFETSTFTTTSSFAEYSTTLTGGDGTTKITFDGGTYCDRIYIKDIVITCGSIDTTKYLTTCCTALGSINGSVSLSNTETTMTVKDWSAVDNASSYTVRLYKWNSGTSSWGIVSGSTSGGSSGTQGTRTGITDKSTGVTWSSIEYGATYKVTVQAIGNGSTYCDGPETAVTSVNSNALTDNKILWKYSIYIDDGTNSDSGWGHNWIGSLTSNEGEVTINGLSASTTYKWKLTLGGVVWYSANATMTSANCTNWTLYSNVSQNCGITTALGGNYKFTVNTGSPKVSVTYPAANQTAGYIVYWDASIHGDNWSELYFRVGTSGDANASSNCKVSGQLVTGTDNFYKVTTASFTGLAAWAITNKEGWTGSNTNGVYKTNTGDTHAITKSSDYQNYAVPSTGVTLVPNSSGTTGSQTHDNNCTFYPVTKTDGMLTHTATISATSNGSINLAYTDVSGTSQPENTSTVSSLAHRTKLTATATPSTGYQLSTFTVTPSGESAQNLSSGDNHILAKDATFAATFAAKTYAISLDRNGGTTGATGVTMTYNSSSFTGWSAPSRTGYTFDGYYTSETNDNGSGTLVINTSGVLQANVDGYTGANGIWTKDATCTLYAKWTANPTTVALTAGTGKNGSASYLYDGTSYSSFTAAERVGYTCTGYWTNTGGTGTKILNANGSFAASTISGYVTSDKWSYTTASTLTLYAGWTNTYAGYAFDLLEDVRDISAGSKIILIGTNAAGSTYKAMNTTQNSNNRGSVAAADGEFVMSNSNKTATLGASTSVQVITLEDLATPAANTYQFNVENGYLYATGTNNAYLKTQPTNSAYGHWLVAVDANTKKATMTGQGGNSYNKIYFNSSSSIFAGYSNAQQPTYIYFNETRTKYTITWDKDGHGTAPTYPTNAARVTMPDISVTGFTNTGWKADKAVTNVSTGATISAGTLISNDTRVQLSANTTFTAQWSTDVYTISTTLTNISVNSAFPSSFTYTGATTTDLDRTLSVTSAYALPTNLTVTMGGNACTNGTEYTYDSGTGAFTFNVVITGNIVITGTALNKYTITLNPGNGSLTAGGGWSADGDNLVQVVVEGNNVTLPTPTPGCAGWGFKGWKLGSAANNQSSFTPDKTDGATFAPNATSTYYAVYRASTASGTNYSKIENEGEFVSGDYAIVAKWSSTYKAMGNSTSSSHMTEATAAENSWTNSDADYIWNIIKMGDKVGFYNDDESKFLTIVNGAWVLATEVQWYTYSFNSTTKAWTFTSPSGKQIGYDSWFNVLSAQNNAIYLYKRNTESGNYFTSPDCSSLTVTGVSDPVGAATVEISATTAHEGDKIWAYYTINRGYSFNHWDKSGTGATLSSTSTRLTRLTVGSTNASVTAVCDALTSYTLNYHDGDGNHTMTVYEGEKILEMLPEPSESCDDESTSFVGWSTTEIRTKTDVEPTFVSSSAVINSTTAASTYYAVYAKATGGSGNETLSCTAGTVDNNTMTFNTTNFTFVHKKNDSGASMSSYSPWRVYEKNTVEISGSLTITGLDIVHSEDYYGNLSSSAGTLTLASSSGGTTTVRDINSTSVTILNASGAAQSRWSSIKVYYTSLSYSKYITTCCDAPTITISGTGKTVTDGKISFPVLREDLGGASTSTWAELPITISSNSSGTITIIEGTGGDAGKTAWKLSSWESRAETGGTIAATGHATFTSPSAGNYLFKVKTTTGQTGQGTYRIGIHQAADATYCEATYYLWVDVTMRDKFVDNVNGNATINVDTHGATTTTPTEASLDADKNDDCHSTTRRFLGWVREDDMNTWYVTGNSTRVSNLDDKKEDAKLVAPGATITTSGATWYAVWGEEVTE